MLGLFRKKKLPNRTLIINTIPYSEISFKDLCNAGTSDFIKSIDRDRHLRSDELWDIFSDTASQLSKTLNKVAKWGATIVWDGSLEDLDKSLDYDIIVIIAHHSNSSDEIEFKGELKSSRLLIESFPVGLRGFVDLTSCYSSYLIPRLKLRNPECRFIGIDVATSLSFRLLLLEETLNKLRGRYDIDYRQAMALALVDISTVFPSDMSKVNLVEEKVESAIKWDGTPETVKGADDKEKIKLGDDKMSSSIFAPEQVAKGQTFLVQIFIHKDSDSDEVALTAKMIDEDSSVRNTKKLKIQIKEYDKLDFQLIQVPRISDDFTIEEEIKGIIWTDEPSSVEFAVEVSQNCSLDAFIGKIKIAVNKTPVGDVLFKTKIVNLCHSSSSNCAHIEFESFDVVKNACNANLKLLEHLDKIRCQLRKSPSSASKRDLDMCEKCIELLNRTNNRNSKILRVFISSTSDMRPYRMVIKQQVDSCAMYADMYELWGQGNEYPRDTCCMHVLESDIFVCILGSQYGFVEPCWGLSMTEIEYRIAERCGIPILIYIQDSWQDAISMDKLNPELVSNAVSQEALINELRINRLVHFFHNENKLASQVISELLTLKYTISNGVSKR